MAGSVIVDSGFLVAFASKRDRDHDWALSVARLHAPPWQTCEAVLSETNYVLGKEWLGFLATLIKRRALICDFHVADSVVEIVDLMEKYADVPMSFADACLVRMTEIMPNPILLTTDSDFRIYRRLGRRTVPTMMPRDRE